MKSPFWKFEADYLVLFRVVGEASQKLSAPADKVVASLALSNLVIAFSRFRLAHLQALSKLLPTKVKGSGATEELSAHEINQCFNQLAEGKLLTAKEETRLHRLLELFGPDFKLSDSPKKGSATEWHADSEFLFDLAIKIARETGVAALRGLDSRKSRDAKVIEGINRLLYAHSDNLL